MAGAAGAMIECQGVTKVFKDFWLRPRVLAVDGLDLRVEPREVFGLLGPNGSGKSTTIKLLLGLLFPSRGRIAVLGKPPADVGVKARVGYLPEESYLYRFLNARETLDFFGRLFQIERLARRQRIEMLLEMVGLEAVRHRPVGEYSKGMQRRLGLAQALINDPDLLILDEPTTGLDPLGTRQIKDLILHLKTRGKTVLLCSHLLGDVEDVCDRVTILYGGKVRALGAVGDLLAMTDSLLLETGRLEPGMLARVRELLEREGQTLKVAQPRKKLETLFLEIVRQARVEGLATSGAREGGPIASFLGGAQPAEGARLLESLLAAPPHPAPAKEAAEARTPAGLPDQSVLERLTQVRKDEPAAAGSGEEEKPRRMDGEDRAVIDELLGGERK